MEELRGLHHDQVDIAGIQAAYLYKSFAEAFTIELPATA